MVAPPTPIPGMSDAAERASALDTAGSWIVEAPAGSGKTGLLIQRYLKLLATVDDPAEVLALTFTQKATGEMHDRVLRALRSAAEPQPEGASEFQRLTYSLARAAAARDAERGWRLLDRPHRLNIRTIDSLCREIARSTPLLSGAIGHLRPVNDPAPLYARAARTVMLRLGGEDAVLNRAIETVLLHRDGDLPFCERVLAEMLATREQWGKLVPLRREELVDARLDAQVLPRLNASLQRAVCASLTELHRCFEQHVLDRLADIARRLAHAEGFDGQPSAFRACSLQPRAPGTDHGDLDRWILFANLLLTGGGTWRQALAGQKSIGAKVPKELAGEIKEVLDEIKSDELASVLNAVRSLPPAEYPERQWHVVKALFRLLQHALVELDLLFGREGVCDFSAIALAARAALNEEGSNAQVVLGTKLRHLLVDEMQDTSTSQYELLETITAGWDGSSQTLFLVGDPKQSIYLFRQARVELFQQCMKDKALGDIELGVLQLSANFRSGSELVREFNETFTQVFPGPEEVTEGDVSFSEATATQPTKTDEGIRWNLWLQAFQDEQPARAALRQRALRQEAMEIALAIRDERRLRPQSRIAVLTRARTHVTEITRTLRRYGIAYRAVDIDALGERREVLDILAITRALLNPADRTAWLAMLHAPWCGAGLADLHRLTEGDRRETKRQILREHFRSRLQELAEPVRGRVQRTLDVMDAALQHTGTESFSSRVERTWRSLGGDACTNANGRENVRQFLRVLDTMEIENESVTIRTLKRRLDRLFAEPENTSGAVEIMTIHKAKGLEWDMVLVPGLHRISALDRYPALDWLEMAGRDPADGSRDVLLAPLPSKGTDTDKLFPFIRATRARRANAELKRVLYVAATRARTALHLFAWPQATKDGKAVNTDRTLLRAAGKAAEGHLKLLDVPDEPVLAGVPETLALAAAADDPPTPVRTVDRLPDGYDPLAELRHSALPLASHAAAVTAPPPYSRAEGSFGARAVGSAVHSFLERLTGELAQRIGCGTEASSAAQDLLVQLAGWQPAIRAVLRSGGLPQDTAERAVKTVTRALETTLRSADGLWLLLPRAHAASESAWRSSLNNRPLSVRLDRTFLAGALPGSQSQDTLWIVDYKTADHAADGSEAFLREEREQYRSQLETYARLRLQTLPPGTRVMLGLFYPLMGRLVSWAFEDAANANPAPPEEAERTAPVQLAMFA